MTSQLGLTSRRRSILTGRRRMKSQPLKNCSLFDLLTSQPIHHVQAENSRNFISFLFRFNFTPLYSYSCLITLRIDIWSDVIFFSGNQEGSFSLKNYHLNQFYFFNTQLLDY